MFTNKALRMPSLTFLLALFLYPIVQASLVLNIVNFNSEIAEITALDTTGTSLTAYGYQQHLTTTSFSRQFSRIP